MSGTVMAESVDQDDGTGANAVATTSTVYGLFTGALKPETSLTMNVINADQIRIWKCDWDPTNATVAGTVTITRAPNQPLGTGAGSGVVNMDLKTDGGGAGRRTYRASSWSRRGANTFASASDYVFELTAEPVNPNLDGTVDGVTRIGCGIFRRSTEETFK